MATPRPEPAALQAAKGDPRKIGRKKLEQRVERESRGNRGCIECPKHLKGRARATWEFWAVELEAMSQDHRPDGIALEGACTAYATAVEADICVRDEGIIIREPIIHRDTGEVIGEKLKNHPALATSFKCWSQVRSFCTEFGFTPVSRARIHMENNDKEAVEDLAAMLSGPRPERPAVQ